MLFPSPISTIDAHDELHSDELMRYKPLGHCCDILTSLPLDIARYILSQLPLRGVLNASLVSRAWNQIVSDAILWRLLFERKEKWHICTDLLPRLPHIPYKDPTLPFVDWKSVYMNRLELDRRWYTLKTKPRGDSIAIPFQPSKVPLEGHTNSVYCTCISSPTATSPHVYVFSGSRDNNVCIWDSETGRCLASLHGHQGSVLSMSYRDGFLLTGSSDNTACLWECSNFSDGPIFHMTRALRGHNGGVLSVCFDDTWIVTGSRDATVRVWRRMDGQLVHIFYSHGACVNACSLDRGRVASAASNGTAFVWDVATGAIIQNWKGVRRGIASIQLRNSIGFTGSSDSCIRLWRVSDNACLLKFFAHEQLVRSLCYDQRRELLVSGGWDGMARVWDMSPTLAHIHDTQGTTPIPTPRLLFELRVPHTRVFDVGLDVSHIIVACENHTLWMMNFGSPELDARVYA